MCVCIAVFIVRSPAVHIHTCTRYEVHIIWYKYIAVRGLCEMLVCVRVCVCVAVCVSIYTYAKVSLAPSHRRSLSISYTYTHQLDPPARSSTWQLVWFAFLQRHPLDSNRCIHARRTSTNTHRHVCTCTILVHVLVLAPNAAAFCLPLPVFLY